MVPEGPAYSRHDRPRLSQLSTDLTRDLPAKNGTTINRHNSCSRTLRYTTSSGSCPRKKEKGICRFGSRSAESCSWGTGRTRLGSTEQSAGQLRSGS